MCFSLHARPGVEAWTAQMRQLLPSEDTLISNDTLLIFMRLGDEV